ncbi:hypothetical protein HN604_01445 [archaeon]|jgi:hypothetical protein|nr:hypothetical protein [archaeon]MBT6182273.1 hypothetical protein [archaeon]MBT6606354.1 hypothetical protein [archaeon]MBT7251477.1 hypothetical protein [archaeon]MBT7660727.1 hypothetical protein [archaeon]
MDTKDLENAIDSAKNVGEPAKEDVAPKMSKEEEIGFHKGSVNTLVAERGELVKMVSNVEVLLKAHVDRLKELGIEFK